MNTTFQLNCPHCRTTGVAFELTSESWLPRRTCWQVCARCNHCAGLVVLEFEYGPNRRERPSDLYAGAPHRFTIGAMYPASEAAVPPHLPSHIERLFRQGADNVPGNADAAGIMFRKTLEATLRDKCPAATGSLFERIDQAATSGILTADLARYAHTIRLEGNEAAHGAYDEADAQRLHSLVTLVLQYVYTLPGMQAQIDAEASAAAQSETVATEED